MNKSRIDLVNHRIPRAFRGYDCAATERLLQDLSDALARATDDRLALASRVKELEARVDEYRQRDAALQETLAAGRRVTEEMRTAAQKEAHVILDAARVKAEALVHTAEARLARILEQAADAKKARARFMLELRSVIREHARLLEFYDREQDQYPLPSELGPGRNTPEGNA